MWPFGKKKSDFDNKVAMSFHERYRYVENFAKIGDYIEYLGVKMLVVGYHNYNCPGWNTPALHVEWMDTYKRIQRAYFYDYNLPMCKHIPATVNGLS